MTLALFSDIHANLPALEAFFADVEQFRPDALYCLGDLVGYNVWPNEVIDEIRRRSIPCIAGNYDVGIGRSSEECGCAYRSVEEKTMGQVSISYTHQSISSDNRAFLRTLPEHIRVDYRLNDEKLSVLMVHGSPRRVNEYLFEDRDEKSLLRIMDHAQADVLCFGHTHQPYHRILTTHVSGTPRYVHAINAGSIGKPKDRDPRGGYVLLRLDSSSSVFEKDSIQVRFRRFAYDVERAAQAIENSPLPSAYATMLRTG